MCSCRTSVRMIACLAIPGLELKAALRRSPTLALRPTALAPEPQGEPLLGPVTAAAEAAGVRGKALFAAGRLALQERDFAAARSLLEQSRAAAEQGGDAVGLAWARHGLAMLELDQCDRLSAPAPLEAGLGSFRELDDLLLHGVRPTLQRLRPGDTIMTPPLGAELTVEGMVRRPAIYELNREGDLAQALALAGGVLDHGHARRRAAGLRRNRDGAPRYLARPFGDHEPLQPRTWPAGVPRRSSGLLVRPTCSRLTCV